MLPDDVASVSLIIAQMTAERFFFAALVLQMSTEVVLLRVLFSAGAEKVDFG